jgi:ABC-type transport system involved in multi-copper enzyme maturation permease subunit
MRKILEIARLQMWENLRRQMHLITLFVAFLLLMLPSYVNAFSMGQAGFNRVAKDAGLAVIEYFGVAFALYFGSTAIPHDMERKTIYPLLARPLSRISYLLGQFLGLSALLAGSLALLAVCFYGALSLLSRDTEDVRFYWVVYSQFLEAGVLMAACIFFSTRCSPALAGVLGMFTYIVGGLSETFIRFFIIEDRENITEAALVKAVKGLMPNFEVFHLKMAVVHWIEIPPHYLQAVTLYGLGWIAFLLLLTEFSFSKKDL